MCSTLHTATTMYPPASSVSRHLQQAVSISPHALGELVRSIGTPSFVSTLNALLTSNVAADAVHLERTRPDPASATGFSTEWIGSAGEQYDLICEVMREYYKYYSQSDPLFSALRGVVGTQLIQRDVTAITDQDLVKHVFEPGRVAQECVLSHGTRVEQYSLALVRIDGKPIFTLAEMMLLRQMGEFLFPLFEVHCRTTAARRISTVQGGWSALSRFDERIANQKIRLSRREYEICKCLLSGQTIPECAQSLDLRTSTAESYVKRAFAKLGVRTKWQLLQWAHDS